MQHGKNFYKKYWKKKLNTLPRHDDIIKWKHGNSSLDWYYLTSKKTK